ncbi:PQQ-dependent sugar dehydrogenase [Dyadobacter psychrotolerans]|nr:PQQ-dependent sugar dehydrogenase [Dyadobacter psychrotolerans]
MKQKVLHLIFFQILLGGILLAQPPIFIEHYLSGFTRPVKITHAYDSRLFVAEIGGKIKIIKNGSILPTPFLDISSKINDPDWAGIYSIAFDPNYLRNGYFYVMYVMYVVKGKFEVQISRFQRLGSTTSDIAGSIETPILTIPYTDVLGGHRGGDMAFGKDSQFYVSTGDNGPGSRGMVGDPENNAQNMSGLFGKILKINPDNPPTAANATESIWALGLRNPWRFSFDRSNGDLWIGDNGQDGWEEVNYFSVANTMTSRNFGWDYMEGNAVYRDCNCDIVSTFIAPKLTYPGYANNANHTSASVMGGYVYRGSNYPSLKGTYFYGDYQSFDIGVIVPNGYQGFLSNVSYSSLISFGEDQQGELYVISFFNGTLGKLKLPGVPLPVKLESFTAQPIENSVQLKWITTFETNFSHFELEHSPDGKKFQKLKAIQATEKNDNYTYLDNSPFNDLNYYRLKMIDRDNSYQFSHLVFAKPVFNREISVFPNPASEKFMIKGVRPGDTIRMYSITGYFLESKTITSEAKIELDLQNYPIGAYNLSIEYGGSGLVKRFKLVKD